MGSDSTLGQLHQAVQALFGWADSRPHRFVLRGHSLGGSATAGASPWLGAEVPLSEFKLLAKEKFFYDCGFDHVNVPVWRHEIRFEAALASDRERLPHCIGGVGGPPLEQTGSPQELSNLADLFTPQFVLNQLTELVDRGSSDAELAQHMRHLHPRPNCQDGRGGANGSGVRTRTPFERLHGLILGGFVPSAVYALVHFEAAAHPIFWVMILGGLAYSAISVFHWAKSAFHMWVKAVGFVLLLEGMVTFSNERWLGLTGLVLLVTINGISAAVALQAEG